MLGFGSIGGGGATVIWGVLSCTTTGGATGASGGVGTGGLSERTITMGGAVGGGVTGGWTASSLGCGRTSTGAGGAVGAGTTTGGVVAGCEGTGGAIATGAGGVVGVGVTGGCVVVMGRVGCGAVTPVAIRVMAWFSMKTVICADRASLSAASTADASSTWMPSAMFLVFHWS